MPKTTEIIENLRFREKTNGRPTIFVCGSWQPEKAIGICAEARKLGQLLAGAGFDLTIGPGTGIARFVIDGYRSMKERGKVIFYLPKESEMERVGEPMEEGADVVYKTGLDYPLRNIIQVRESNGLVAICGGAGTVTEVVTAAFDYNKPTIVFQEGEAYEAVRRLSELQKNIIFTSSVEEAVKILEEKLLKPS